MIIAEFLINDFRFWCDVEEGFLINALRASWRILKQFRICITKLVRRDICWKISDPRNRPLKLALSLVWTESVINMKTRLSVIETKQKLFINRAMLENIHLLMRITFIWKPSWFANSFWTLQSCQDAESISNRKYLQRLLKMWSWECLICHYSMTAQLIYSHSCLFIGKSFACDDTNTFQERIYSNSKSKMFKIVISRKSQKRKGLKYRPYIVGFQTEIFSYPYYIDHIIWSIFNS